ncbi:pistil-specific extensin-like protein [Mangifera indica]|uniref:pistil-specific extensin-like protein n=1 Tax=Mangifera indica TaxID=29780 RepID=UPI001CFA1793|nr:pistil-specific extensin-like protein [Mangifera indica]
MESMVMKVLLLAAAFFTVCTNFAVGYDGYGGNTGGVTKVTGQVLCQDCSKSYNEWVNNAIPLKGVKVSLTCMDNRRRVMYYRSDETNEEGRFEMSVDKYAYQNKEVKSERCRVRLVSSPHPGCNVFTDFNGGKSGVKLRRPSSVYRDTVAYTMQPFYFTSPMCEKPDVQELQANNY